MFSIAQMPGIALSLVTQPAIQRIKLVLLTVSQSGGRLVMRIKRQAAIRYLHRHHN